jgi:hypothetical protein
MRDYKKTIGKVRFKVIVWISVVIGAIGTMLTDTSGYVWAFIPVVTIIICLKYGELK